MGIAQIAIRPTPPQSNGHSVAPIFGQNHANARLYMDIIPKNRCHKPSWQGFRPPHPNGQCPNEQRFFFIVVLPLGDWHLGVFDNVSVLYTLSQRVFLITVFGFRQVSDKKGLDAGIMNAILECASNQL